MTRLELADRVCSGLIPIVGELRAVDVRESGFVDTKSGNAQKSLGITYFVERKGGSHGYEIVKITRWLPPDTGEADRVRGLTEIGKTYAFGVESLERKPGYVSARLGVNEPLPIEEEEESGGPVDAPSGAAIGAALP